MTLNFDFLTTKLGRELDVAGAKFMSLGYLGHLILELSAETDVQMGVQCATRSHRGRDADAQ